MRVLHTSDWHIGRTFHGNSTVEALRQVLGALTALVADQGVDVVLVAGDVFDSTVPAAEHYTLLTDTLLAIADTGAEVVVTSGNHDSAARLGFQAPFTRRAGIHMVTRHEQHLQPVTLEDDHGPVHIYGIPYLEPALIRHHYPQAALKRHDDTLAFVMDRVRADMAERGGRSVVVSHCFAAGVAACDVERDITAGGLDFVSVDRFDGPDYVALGHIHGRAQLRGNVRYCGAPLHYSFKEAGKPRGVWLVDLGPGGFEGAAWADLPVPRPLVELTGDLDQLLTDPALAPHEGSWVNAVLTDSQRPVDAMTQLKRRFPWCAALEYRPAAVAATAARTYTQRVRAKSDTEVVAEFLSHVRNGNGPTPAEAELVRDTLADVAAKGARA